MKFKMICPVCVGGKLAPHPCKNCGGIGELVLEGEPILPGLAGKSSEEIVDEIAEIATAVSIARGASPFPPGAGRMEFEDAPSGTKYDAGKEPMGLLPWDALFEVARVLDYGEKKYSANGWRNVKPRSRYLDAAFRHLAAYAQHGDLDDESGLPHLAHAACCVLFMLSFYLRDEECRW